ncbi:MAG: hypothetical protein EB127_06635 [Alphaproteobacteria bacterium]|nr:hypothetical protein [Alphaproteobacteria bacterium]
MELSYKHHLLKNKEEMKINKNSLEYQASWYVAALTNMNPILLDRLFIDVCNRVPDAFPGLNGEIEKAISSTLDLDGSESSNSEIESSISSNEEKSQSQDCQLQIAIVRKLMYLGANINIHEGGLSGGAPIH